MPIHALGPFRLNTDSGVLLRGTERVALGSRAIALLEALLERPGAVVPKDALIEAAWSGQIVEEANLTVQIAALRRVLGEAPGGEHWIATMPRRGYRFIGPVVTDGENAIASPPRADVVRDPAVTRHDVAAGSPVIATTHERAGVTAGAVGSEQRSLEQAERRQVTALSCELLGVAAGPGGVDLDDLRETIGEFQRCVSRAADLHEGSSRGA